MKKDGMDEAALLNLISEEEERSMSYFGGSLSAEREKALEFYYGNLDIQAAEGRSAVVSTDVRDAIDGMLPDLLDVFLSSNEVVKFEPSGPEDEKAAKQASEYANYVFYRQNNGALILYEWFKTALLEKNGVVKYWWENSEKVSRETYEGLNEAQFQMLAADENVEIVAHTETPVPQDQMPQMPPQAQGQPQAPMQQPMMHDVTIAVKKNKGKICIQTIPPEEFLISMSHTSLSMKDCRFAAHRSKKTASQLLEMGIDVTDMPDGDDNPTDYTPEALARRRFAEERMPQTPTGVKEYGVLDCYVVADVDGDGFDELRHVIRINKTVMVNEEAELIPFAAICPAIMPFRFYGLSIADLLIDIQRNKSVLKRQMYDSLYLANNPRIGVQENMVNLDDLLVSRPGGIVRFRGPPGQSMMPIETRFVAKESFPMLEYEDSVKESRTGFTRYSQGMDADSLNKTATGISLITTASGKRLKLVARMFAETGIKDLFKGIVHLMSKYNTKPQLMRLRNTWETVDPRQWSTEWDMTVTVGLGTGDKTQQLQMLQNIVGMQKMLLEGGKTNLVHDDNLFNAARRMTELSGFKHEEEFFMAPNEQNPPPQQPPPPEVLKMQADTEEAKMKVASAERIKGAEMQHGESIAQIQERANVTIANINSQTQKEIAALNAQKDKDIAEMKMRADAESLLYKSQEDRANNAMQANAKIDQIHATHKFDPETGKEVPKKNPIMDVLQASIDAQHALIEAITLPNEVIRDKAGKVVGTKKVRVK